MSQPVTIRSLSQGELPVFTPEQDAAMDAPAQAGMGAEMMRRRGVT